MLRYVTCEPLDAILRAKFDGFGTQFVALLVSVPEIIAAKVQNYIFQYPTDTSAYPVVTDEQTDEHMHRWTTCSYIISVIALLIVHYNITC